MHFKTLAVEVYHRQIFIRKQAPWEITITRKKRIWHISVPNNTISTGEKESLFIQNSVYCPVSQSQRTQVKARKNQVTFERAFSSKSLKSLGVLCSCNGVWHTGWLGILSYLLEDIQHGIAATLKAPSKQVASMMSATLGTTSCLAQQRGFSPAGHLHRAYLLSGFVPEKRASWDFVSFKPG